MAAVKIAHANISEKGTINGVKGDSTGKEVCIWNFDSYTPGWGYVAIHPDAKIREAHAKANEDAVANDAIGYGQGTRNTANAEAKKVGYVIKNIKTPCNCDCSSLQNLCAVVSGAPGVTYGKNGWTTRTMKEMLKAAGYIIVEDAVYLKSSYCVRGAIYVRPGYHTACGLTNGSNANKTLAKAGIITVANANTSNTTKKGCGYMFTPEAVAKGSKGKSVALMQTLLRGKGYKGADGEELKIDSICGGNSEYAINSYQAKRRKQGVELGTKGKNDGCCGTKMWADLIGL